MSHAEKMSFTKQAADGSSSGSCATIYYCPIREALGAARTHDHGYDVPVGHRLLGQSCDRLLQAIRIPDADLVARLPLHERRSRWYGALRVALRSAGRSPLNREERRTVCRFFRTGEEDLCVKALHRDYLLLAHLMANTSPSTVGLWLEFGVFKGASLNITCDAKRRLLGTSKQGSRASNNGRINAVVHGFDSFQGLPTNWTIARSSLNVNKRHARCGCGWAKGGANCGKGDGSRCWATCCVNDHTKQVSGTIRDEPTTEQTLTAGTFSLHGVLPAVRANAALHRGWFNKTLPPFLAAAAGPVSYVSLDMDLYGGAMSVLRALTPRLVGGGRVNGGTLLHFHELIHSTDDGSHGVDTTMMDEARALFDWLHGVNASTSTPCISIELVATQVRRRDEAAAFFVLGTHEMNG